MTDPLKYTESDMQVLTEAALRLGRKEAGEEIAAAIDAELGVYGSYADQVLGRAAKIARDLACQPPPDSDRESE